MKQRRPAWTAALLGALLLAACHRPAAMASGPLPQRGYLWQRTWTPAVAAALAQARSRMQGVVLLGGEIEWTGTGPSVVRATIDWEQVKAAGVACSVALRVAPLPGMTAQNNAALRSIEEVATALLSEARAHGVQLQEFQLDFDCAQKNLAAYRGWLRQLRPIISPTRFVITTLPSWLDDEPEFEHLVREVDSYVLQVHSVPLADTTARTLCDPRAARRWVQKAARLRRSFSVALPTYRCTAGYNPAGKLLGVAMDSVPLSWPPETRTLEFTSDAEAIAALVNEWEQARPAELRELLWYRLPVATDTRNWRWPTLGAVMSGRKPTRRFEARQEGENPIDISITNSGESDDELRGSVRAKWSGGQLVASDALTGWEVSVRPGEALFTVAPGQRLRLPPGATRRIGWLRQAAPVKLDLDYVPEDETVR